MKLFGREPALILGFIAAVVKLLGYQFDVSAGTQTAINVLAASVVGLILAIVAKTGAWAAALLQAAQAVMALFGGLGLDWSADLQAYVMAAIAAGLALYERTQITPPLPDTRLEQSSPIKPPLPRAV
ncbi:hypothetical protein [Streptomyces sp. XY533]|uniref:hypothetical protein n=1 Tax=Streptomyces sp. XY533 TaxID=1519481 RepID=UPI0006AEE96B|nr:hypothetical protein [Streptomyces sp. XY533]KOV07528.1 hypothetical protein ADK92_05820 [Streptomyces sp. XY533]